MKKLLLSALLCLSVFFTLTGCNGNQNEDNTDYIQQEEQLDEEYNLQRLLDIAYNRRTNIILPTYEQIAELTESREPRTIDMRSAFAWPPDRGVVMHITAEEATEDALLFFKALRQVYGPYIYFGGDEVFNPLFDNIIAQISDYETLSVGRLERIIFNELNPVINDNHFRFGGHHFRVDATFYTSNTPFDRHQQGFRHRENGLLVTEIEGHDIDRVFRLSMDTYGDIFYSPVKYVVAPFAPQTYDMNIVFEDGSVYSLMLRNPGALNVSPSGPRLEFVDGIAVVTVRDMGYNPSRGTLNHTSAINFMHIAEQIRDEPVIIIDVRHNAGGDDGLGARWLYRLMREVVPLTSIWLTTDGRATVTRHPADAYRLAGDRTIPPGDIYFIREYNQLIENNQLIIMLIDRFTVSAAEGFANQMFSMKNTLVIGQNTAGMLVADAAFVASDFSLPNSGIRFGFGVGVFVYPDDFFAEGVGIAPDVWVHGDALQAALALLCNR